MEMDNRNGNRVLDALKVCSLAAATFLPGCNAERVNEPETAPVVSKLHFSEIRPGVFAAAFSGEITPRNAEKIRDAFAKLNPDARIERVAFSHNVAYDGYSQSAVVITY
jgi:hypothetical protein